MNLIWGSILIIFTLSGWLAQVINAYSAELAAKWGLSEPESDVDATYFVDGRGEAVWDAMSIWTLPVAGVLLILNNPSWAYFGLVGGGMYLYFAGRGIVVRVFMNRRGIRTGNPGTVKLAYAFFIASGLIGVTTIIMAAAALPLP